MTLDPKDSQTAQDKKNAKKYLYISLLAFVILFPLVYFLSDNPLGVLHQYPLGWLLYVITPLLAGIMIWGDFKDKSFATETGRWYIVLLILFAACLIFIGYCPFC